MKRLKILQINKYYAPHIGGVERVVQGLSEGLRDRCDVRVLVCNKKCKTERDIVNGVEVIRTSSLGSLCSMPLSASFAFYMRKLARDADILQFHMPFPLGDAAYFLSNYGGKTAVFWHSDVVRQRRLVKLYKPLMNAFLRRADLIITATQGHIDGSAYLAPYREKCVVVPYGIDADAYAQNAAPQRVLLEAEEGVAQILFVGRLVDYKGVDVLLNAMAQVKNAQLAIVGDGPCKQELKALADRLHISDHVWFMGSITDAQIKACMRDCDIFVLPSVQNSEAFGLVQLQAMCYAKPVINTALPTGVPYVSVHEHHGLTVPPGDAAALAKAIQLLADQRDYAQKLGQNGAVHVRKDFSMNAMIEGVYAQYLRLLGISGPDADKDAR